MSTIENNNELKSMELTGSWSAKINVELNGEYSGLDLCMSDDVYMNDAYEHIISCIESNGYGFASGDLSIEATEENGLIDEYYEEGDMVPGSFDITIEASLDKVGNIRFEDLSEISQEHILSSLRDGSISGTLSETVFPGDKLYPKEQAHEEKKPALADIIKSAESQKGSQTKEKATPERNYER